MAREPARIAWKMSRTSSKLATEIRSASLSYRWYAVKIASQPGTASTASSTSTQVGAETAGKLPIRSAITYVSAYAMVMAIRSPLARSMVRPRRKPWRRAPERTPSTPSTTTFTKALSSRALPRRSLVHRGARFQTRPSNLDPLRSGGMAPAGYAVDRRAEVVAELAGELAAALRDACLEARIGRRGNRSRQVGRLVDQRHEPGLREATGEIHLVVVGRLAVRSKARDDERADAERHRGQDGPRAGVRNQDPRAAHVVDELGERQEPDAARVRRAQSRVAALHDELLPARELDAVERLEQSVERLAGADRHEDHPGSTVPAYREPGSRSWSSGHWT